MNLASYASHYNLRDKVKEFLCSILKENIRIGDGHYTIFIYPLTDRYAISISVFNEYGLDESHYNEFIDMLLEDMNELELSILSKDTNGDYNLVHGKSSYPFNELGDEGYKYLMMQDTSRSNAYCYTLDSIHYVIDYLRLLFKERPNILAASECEPAITLLLN